MPGRSEADIEALLDAAHRAMVAAFNTPERDRYQLVHEIPRSRFIAEDTGLGIPRTSKFVLVEVTSRPRTREEKERFYALLCDELKKHCGIEPSDVMVAITQNTDEDWSFGYGRAQFLAGELFQDSPSLMKPPNLRRYRSLSLDSAYDLHVPSILKAARTCSALMLRRR